MPTAQRKPAKRETLNLRIKPEVRELIDRAARLNGKNRTEFVIGAAQSMAHEALLDQTRIELEPAAFRAFVALLDAPPAPNKRLRRTLTTKAPWEA
jgi:uncharacterized protein (DUF1778 family)